MNLFNDHPLLDHRAARRREEHDLRMAILASQNDAIERRRDSLRAELASQNELNPLHCPLSRSPNRQARRREEQDLRMAVNASFASQNESNQGALDALDRRRDSNDAGLASQNELNQGGLLRALNHEPHFRLTIPFNDGFRTSNVRSSQASQAEFWTREAPARTRDALHSRSPGSHRREARIIPDSQTGLSQRQARRRSLMPSQSKVQSAREARTIPDRDGSGTSYVLSGQASEAEFQTQACLRDDVLTRRGVRILPASAEEAPIMGPIMGPKIPASAEEAPTLGSIMGPIMGHIIPGSAWETRTIPDRVSNPWPRLAEIQSGDTLRRPSQFRRLLSRAMETREREAPRTEPHRTFHISIPNTELASQNQTMNLTSQQAGPAGHFRVSVPRVREAFRRDTNAPDVDQFNATLTQLSAERDLQNV